MTQLIVIILFFALIIAIEILSNRIKQKEESPMMPCKECSKEISKKALTCPYCGITTKYGKKAKRKEKIRKRGNTQGIGCLLILIAIILGFTIIGGPLAIVIGVIGFIILLFGLIPV